MKTIGLLGGMSWESSLEYYRIINEGVKQRLGGSHSAKCVMYSFDFNEIEVLQHGGEWEALTYEMIDKSKAIKEAGADFLVICTNTMHLMVPRIKEESRIEILHIGEVTGQKVVDKGLKKVALLGTKYTMEGTFYKDVIEKKYPIEVMIPKESDREVIHNVIYDELVQGKFLDSSRDAFVEIIEKMVEEGAEGVILGCTEIPLLIHQKDISVPVFNTMKIHAEAAVDLALK